MDNDQLQKGQYLEKRFRASSDDIDVKEDGDGRKRVRMPISSTAEDRDGDEFSVDGLESERDQINEGKVPAFLDHGRGSDGGHYGALGIVGTWADADVVSETHDDETVAVLYADFVPTEANEDADRIVDLLEDDMPVGASVGFRVVDYERDRDEGKFIFHSVDLLETSIVGIPSNPLTVNDGADAVGAKALGSPTSAFAAQRGYPVQQAAPVGPHGTRDATDDLLNEVKELRSEVAALADDGGVDSEADADDTETMSDETDGGDEAATDNDNSEPELRDLLSEQTERVDKLAGSVESLVDTLDERNTEAESEESKESGGDDEDDDEDEDEDEEDDKDADGEDKSVTDDADTVELFVGDDADEDVRKEFEALRERSQDGTIDLADSETKLFGSDDDNDNDNDDNGVLI